MTAVARPCGWRTALAGALLAVAATAGAQSPVRIAIVIDDLGHNLAEGRRALQLPGPVACAILPHQKHSHTLAMESHRQGKEVLLHLPMPGGNGYDAGAGMIDLYPFEVLSPDIQLRMPGRHGMDACLFHVRVRLSALAIRIKFALQERIHR